MITEIPSDECSTHKVKLVPVQCNDHSDPIRVCPECEGGKQLIAAVRAAGDRLLIEIGRAEQAERAEAPGASTFLRCDKCGHSVLELAGRTCVRCWQSDALRTLEALEDTRDKLKKYYHLIETCEKSKPPSVPVPPPPKYLTQEQLDLMDKNLRTTLRDLQLSLPWSDNYSVDFKRDTRSHKNFEHALVHVGKALGKLFALVDDVDHRREAAESSSFTADAAKCLADLVICAMRAANTSPGRVIDLEKAVVERIRVKNPTQRQPHILCTFTGSSGMCTTCGHEASHHLREKSPSPADRGCKGFDPGPLGLSSPGSWCAFCHLPRAWHEQENAVYPNTKEFIGEALRQFYKHAHTCATCTEPSTGVDTASGNGLCDVGSSLWKKYVSMHKEMTREHLK